MKKLLALILIVLILLPAFVACDSSSYAIDLDIAGKDYIDTNNLNPEEETCSSHTGGTATCSSKAQCSVCGVEYGEIDSDKHSGRLDWIKTESTHKQSYSCCGAVALEEEAHEWAAGICIDCGYRCIHKGGTATCASKAVCDICGKEYASKSQSNHTGALKWINTETTHSQFYDCCGTLTVSIETHEWSEGVCVTCGYGCLHTMGTEFWNVSDTVHSCTYSCCGAVIVEEAAHDLKNGICSVCGYKQKIDTTQLYTRDGDKIYFGSYPQTEVTDSSLIATLTGKAGTLPTSDNSYAWTSYGYYADGEVGNYMWYTDIEEGTEKYRGVYFTSYRPWQTLNPSTEDDSVQDGSGYYTDTVYWFKYEPIAWTIIDEDTANGKALILCDMIIDAREYYTSEYDSRTIDGRTVYPSNYAHSTIRAWLNDTFYNTAFSELQKELILTTNVDNSAATTASPTNVTACQNTNDKIFLPSYSEVTDSDYGFSSVATANDPARRKYNTDYAKAQGAFNDTAADDEGQWWLRSPNHEHTSDANVITQGVIQHCSIDDTGYGIVPALNIRLS